jgi:hypothetical protein
LDCHFILDIVGCTLESGGVFVLANAGFLTDINVYYDDWVLTGEYPGICAEHVEVFQPGGGFFLFGGVGGLGVGFPLH